MRSLLISGSYYPPQIGGMSQFASNLAEALGPERVCCLTGVWNEPGMSDPSSGPKIYRYPGAFSVVQVERLFGFTVAMSKIRFEQHPRVTLLGSIDDASLGLFLRRWLKMPLLAFAAGNEILDVIEERWPKPLLALQTAERVLAVSKFTAGFVEKAGVDPDRIEVVYPGYDSSRFRPVTSDSSFRENLLPGCKNDKVILTVGNLVARKGQDITIKALPNVLKKSPDVKYLIVGDGPYKKNLQDLAQELGVAANVIFAGRVADDDLTKLYAIADVFVMPSRADLNHRDVEGFGIVYLEANACGKPVIGGRSGGVPEAIVDGETGLLVDPTSPDDLANAITRLLLDNELSIRLGQQGMNRAMTDFTWSRAADQVQRILESITPPPAS